MTTTNAIGIALVQGLELRLYKDLLLDQQDTGK